MTIVRAGLQMCGTRNKKSRHDLCGRTSSTETLSANDAAKGLSVAMLWIKSYLNILILTRPFRIREWFAHVIVLITIFIIVIVFFMVLTFFTVILISLNMLSQLHG